MNNLLKNYLCLPLSNILISRATSTQNHFGLDKAFNYGGARGNDCTAIMPCISVLDAPKVGGDFVQSNFKF